MYIKLIGSTTDCPATIANRLHGMAATHCPYLRSTPPHTPAQQGTILLNRTLVQDMKCAYQVLSAVTRMSRGGGGLPVRVAGGVLPPASRNFLDHEDRVALGPMLGKLAMGAPAEL